MARLAIITDMCRRRGWWGQWPDAKTTTGEAVCVVETVYLNGSFIPYSEALVPFEDRGMLFADGIYEVVRAYDGRFFALEGHLQRLVASAQEIQLEVPPVEELQEAIQGVMERSGLHDTSIYLQVTRGFAGARSHGIPHGIRPTVFAAARPVPRPDPRHVAEGATAITVPDRRWHMCHVKSIGLLLNNLAKQAALDAGAQEALFVREGVLTEGAATNAFAVFDGEVWTHPEGHLVLSGITRQVVIELAHAEGLTVREEPYQASRMYGAQEVFVTSTNLEVLPIRAIDGRSIGSGVPGAVTRRLQAAFTRRTSALAAV